jgi:AraC-like DNA-binding protein
VPYIIDYRSHDTAFHCGEEVINLDNGFFLRFHPRIIDVVKRGQKFWYGRNTRRFEASVKRNFMYVTAGEGTLIFNSVCYPLSAGSVFYFPLLQSVQLTTFKDRQLLFYSVHYDYKLIEWEGSSAVCVDPERDRLPIPIVTQMYDTEGFTRRMDQLYELWQQKDADYEWEARLAFLNLVAEVHRLNAQRQDGDLARRAIIKSMEYIKIHYAKSLEREELAEVAAISVSYFSILFKKVTGCTPTQYITKIRLDKAKQLLQSSNMTVSEVAREVGFQDPLYFARVFANHAGMPPREYRKV